ncbi:hypothetical protein GALL_454420 [mine drainage metagenome]|uniref:Uncharacterized protein n=1 Tax=mine drainage metagenome TaxID=410659 RepID=A0A1J5PYN9_9ZZZZ
MDRSVGVDRDHGCAVSAIRSRACGLGSEHPVERGPVDHASAKIWRFVGRSKFGEGQHASDHLSGYCPHAGYVPFDHGRHELGTLHWAPRLGAAFDGNDAVTGVGSNRGRPASGRPKPDHHDVWSFAHPVLHAAQVLRPPRPSSAIEQQACSCSIGRPMARASATIPSAG